MSADTFQLPEGIILLNVLHRVNLKTPQHLNVLVLNINNVSCSIGKNMPIASMHPVGKCEEVQEVSWSSLLCDTSKVLPQIPQDTSFQLEPDTNGLARSIPNMDIPRDAKTKLQGLLDKKYPQIISKNALDIGGTNLIKLDILTEGPPITSKPYTVPLKYHEFLDHEIKQLEEAGIISLSMSDWASPTPVVPKNQDHMETNNSQGSSNFNLWLCINYRKLNSHIQTACQIKADSSLGKVISNYPLPTINSILAYFKGCKYFSTIDFRLGYYHIKLGKEEAEKTVFVTDKGKWIFHSLPFSINIGPSMFSYVLGKLLMQCSEYILNYHDDIMVFSVMWETHLTHLKEVFKWLQDADLKIKCSKCEFFKSTVHYLGYLVGTDGVQPLPEGHCHRGIAATSEHRGTAALLRPHQILQEVYPILCQHNCLLQHHAEKGSGVQVE